MTEKLQPKFFYGYIIVVVAFLLMLMMWGAYYSFGIFFEPLLAEFGWTKAMTSGAFSLSFFLTGILGVFAGRLTDRFGPRVVLTVCGFFLGLGYLLVSQTSTVWQLYLFYGVVVALGMSASVIPLQSTLARWFVKRRGTMNGIIISGIGVGMVIIPPIAQWLISSYGWRTSYIVVGITALVTIILTAQFLRRDPGKMGQLPYGEGELEIKVSSPDTGFSLREALRSWQFWTLVMALLCFTMGEGTILVHIVSHAIGLGISAASAALIIPVIGAISIPGRILLGMAGDRIGNRPAYVIGFVFLSVSLFWLLVAKELWMLYLFAVIYGFGYGGLSALISPIIAELFGLSSHGVIMGVVIMFGGTGGMAIGPLLAGHIFDITGSYQSAFLMYAAISVIGLILVSRLRPVIRKV
ncbi:MAG: MFS transporter [Dehalococcoidia bacterium]|nr:MAG: MFS transporter [Dehalococcoidia bacterium]